MITIQSDGSLAWNSLTDPRHQDVGTLELPADLLEQQSDLLNRVLAFAFDVLGLHTLDLRIRPYLEETYAYDTGRQRVEIGRWIQQGLHPAAEAGRAQC